MQPQPPHVQNPTNWKPLRAALVKSIRQGVFFDQKYWTRHSKDSNVLKPIYFSSLIAGNKLRKCTSKNCIGVSNNDRTRREGIVHSNSQGTTVTPPTDVIDTESDYEDDPMEAGDPLLALGQGHGGDGLVHTNLTPGSFVA